MRGWRGCLTCAADGFCVRIARRYRAARGKARRAKMKRWLRVWILAAPAVAWGQASTGLPAVSATSFTGSLSGDVTGTQSATTVGKINGGSVPASANLIATNASSQPVAATAHNESTPRTCTTTNSGNAYSCTTSPGFTPAAGDTISIDFNADSNTGSATLAVNGASAATIKKWGEQQRAHGQRRTGGALDQHDVRWDLLAT